ncbi:hypothetical protein SAMN05216345_11049 [Cupriavidus sp. YR651]|uniref:DUF4810 domain-containing protein n=1 Tax=Cupriavidus sp. YR651 TaxID=1855315 RepID=UPI00088B48A0|nr:DUF4810 domain-containing protein [Cupriavidus sp. YR651]SDD50454.1 hypothetical protein SAMN05216345_11049 [Cupriavidus sp. YR651]
MKAMMLRRSRLAGLAVASTLILAGCAAPAPTLYQWEQYQPQVYEYFKGESKAAQLAVLEADLQKILASGKTPPPGFHAHLGLLYADQGKDDEMMRSFQTEKTLFPESGTYIDFLMKNVTRKGGKQ